jgi:glycerol dehydrogenase-like iron-containing ADH family enzyme
MSARRGWSDSRQAKPAAEIDIRYGHQLLAQTSASWPRYLTITSPTAYRTAESFLATAPADVAYINSLDFSYLQQVAGRLPDNAELVVGIGGGQVLDAAKHIAVAKDLPLILVPTIISTGAIIHGHCPRYRGTTLEGDPRNWVWADCEFVLVDYDLTLKAPIHLHTAGLGDVLCGYSCIAEWRYNHRDAPQAISDEPELVALQKFHASIVENFPATLDERGELSAESIHFIMRTLQERDLYRVQVPTAPSADHAFLFALHESNRREWIHGEVVALGALIISWHCNENAQGFAASLDRCRVRRRPSQLGIESPQLRLGLEYLSEYLARRPNSREYNSIMRKQPLVGKQFEELWEFLETA